jgi:hypothetical protein
LSVEYLLDRSWIEQFRKKYGRAPADSDRQDQLFSLLFTGSGVEGAWTEADWELYRSHREALWSGEQEWPADYKPQGYERFETHWRRLAGHYGSGPEAAKKFTRAAGLLWGGIAYEGPALSALFRASIGHHLQQLQEGAAGWHPDYVDDDNPSHHWVAAFVAGFYYGAVIGGLSNSIRDLAQLLTGQGGTLADIRLGNVAAAQGAYLRQEAMANAGDIRIYDRVLARMGAELR